jgi:hypothetical protein
MDHEHDHDSHMRQLLSAYLSDVTAELSEEQTMQLTGWFIDQGSQRHLSMLPAARMLLSKWDDQGWPVSSSCTTFQRVLEATTHIWSFGNTNMTSLDVVAN